MDYFDQEIHVYIRCDSCPFRNTSEWMTLEDAYDYAYAISADAYRADVNRYGDSRLHPVDIYAEKTRNLLRTVTYRG